MKKDIPVYDISSISELRNEDILISRLAPFAESHKNLHNPHRHKFYHVVLFTEGEGRHSVDFQSFDITPYQIYFMVPGQVHSWSFNGPVDGYVINFSVPFFQSFLLRSNMLEDFTFFSGMVNDAVIQIPDPFRSKISALFEDILKEATCNQPFSSDMVRVLLLNIFILVSRLNVHPNETINSSYNYTLLKNFQKLIEKNYSALRLPKEYAGLLYITPNHLNALCNDLLGISAGELIRNRIFLEAKRLLTNLDLNITEISERLNFTDSSYFSKSFKKHTGFSPEEFRKRTLEKITGEASDLHQVRREIH